MDFAVSLESNEDFEQGRQELAKLIGAEEAGQLSWLSRLIRRPDGFKLRVMEPEHDLRSALIVNSGGASWYQHPWLASEHALRIRVREWPLEEGVALLRSPETPETEIHRRRKATAENEERIRLEQIAARERAAAQVAALLRDQQIDREFRRAAWDELSEISRFAYLAAIAIEGGMAPATALRALAKDATKGFRFPGARVWWEAAR